MSAKMQRRRRQTRRRRIRRQRRELGLFYTHGRFPSNAVVCALKRSGRGLATLAPIA